MHWWPKSVASKPRKSNWLPTPAFLPPAVDEDKGGHHGPPMRYRWGFLVLLELLG